MHDDWKKAAGLDIWRNPMQEVFEQQRRMREMLDPPYLRMFRQLEEERESFKRPPALRMVQKINESLGYLNRESLDKANGFVVPADPSETLRQSMEHMRLIGLGREEYFIKAAGLSRAAETRLSYVPWESVGDLLGASAESRSRLQSKFTRLAVSYGRLYKPDLREKKASGTLPEEIAVLPAAEMYQAVELLDAVSSESSDKKEETPGAGQDQVLAVGKALRLETEPALELLLAEIDPGLVKLLEGAKVSANSINPDRVRHAAVSLRELFTHVLHSVAPTDAVKKWSSDPAHYHEGKPTRKARILYVCRAISFGRLSTFILKDIDVSLAFVDLFQRATHEVSAQVSTEQLLVMIVRMECLLRFLLETAKLAQ